MPSLLQINSCANWGSTGKIAEQINNTALGQGWKTYIAYGRLARTSQSELYHIGNICSQAIALVEARMIDNDGLANKYATKELIRRIQIINPDIIHLHNLHGYYINYRLLFDYLNTTNVPIVWTLHDCWSFTGHCGHFVGANCEKWKTGCYDCPLRRGYPSSWLLDRSTYNYEIKKSLFTANKKLHIITVSQWLYNLVKQSFLKDADITVINNGVDVDVFKPSPLPDNSKYRLLGVSSVWTKSKGLYDFYRLREMLDEEKYEITLVGLSEDQISKLPKGINGVARTNSVEELVYYYSTSNVFINPTYSDSFPTTNLEALACGTPVVTYQTGGSPEAITPETGIVVEQGNINALVEAVQTILSVGKQHYAHTCRTEAELRFDKKKKYLEYMNVYNDLILGRR